MEYLIQNGELSIMQKLEILTDAAKYDVACTSSGVERKGDGKYMGNCTKAGICHSFSSDGNKAYPMLRGAVLHSDRGTQYTSELYRKAINKYGILQSMNSAGGRCHDNARCESMWARFKEELLYGRYDTTTMTVEQLKTLIWRYFISYWNNRRICSANGGLPPMVKRQQYYASLQARIPPSRSLLQG